jgi:Zn-dependent protease with chaperone function
MTDDQFDDLIGELEEEIRCNPAAYQFKVSLLATLGNAYISALLLFFVALFAALVVSIKWFNWMAVKPIGFVWVFLGLVLRSSWVKIEPPAGVEIKASQAPALFAMINKLRRELGARRFDHVLITDELNAGVFETPRLGIFGWHRSFLLIGLPLMKSLSCEQLKAVLAHEFGHYAKRHGRVSHSIYRQRLRWTRLMTELETTESKGSFLFKPFFNWFVPYFNRFSFPLARTNEYEADAISVRLTCSRATAEALTSIGVVGGYLRDFYWPVIDAEFGETPQPSGEPYSEMSHAFATRLDKVTGQIWLEPAMARQTTFEDTHPALSERLAAIGEQPGFSPPEPSQAADQLLGPSLEVTTKALDRRWRDNILSSWEHRHEEIQEGRRRLRELNENHANGVDLALEERIERAELTEFTAKKANEALDQWRRLHERAPYDTRICFALGSRLLMRDDDTGCALVERALQLDQDQMLKGCELLRDYHSRRGHEQEFNAWNRRLLEQIELQDAAHRERARVTPTDEFEPHGLPEGMLAALVAQLTAIPGLGTAYFMKKRVSHFQDHPLYVFGYSVTGLFSFERKQRAAGVVEQIQKTVRFPGQTLFINVDGANHGFRRKFRRLRWTKLLYPVSSLAMTIIRTAFQKILGALAVLFGVFMLVKVLNDMFHLTSLIEPEYSTVGLSIGPLLCGVIITIVGTRWLIDPVN